MIPDGTLLSGRRERRRARDQGAGDMRYARRGSRDVVVTTHTHTHDQNMEMPIRGHFDLLTMKNSLDLF